MSPETINIISILSGVFVISIAAAGLSVVFYLSAKKSEATNIKLLAEVNEHVNTLNTINNTLLGTAIQHLVSSNSKMIDKAFPSITGGENQKKIYKIPIQKKILLHQK